MQRSSSTAPANQSISDPPEDQIWHCIRDEAESEITQEPIISNFILTSILGHQSLESSLAYHLSIKLETQILPNALLNDVFSAVLAGDEEIRSAAIADLRSMVKTGDSTTFSYLHCFLYHKGFHACESYRIAHKMWVIGRKTLALVIQSRVSEAFAIDIHPAARIGKGLALNNGVGVVIGETAVVGNGVEIFQGVTLGWTGKGEGDRHPKIGDGVVIGEGACVLGNIRVGENARISAGSVVLKDVPPWGVAVGAPASVVEFTACTGTFPG